MFKNKPSAIETIFRVAIFGPALGSAVCLIGLYASHTYESVSTDLKSWFYLLLVVLIYSWFLLIPGYIIGIIPALLYGALAHRCLHRYGMHRAAFIALWVLLCACILLLLWQVQKPVKLDFLQLSIGLTALVTGAIYPLLDPRMLPKAQTFTQQEP